MKIAVATAAGVIHNIEVDSQIELENLKALIESETEIPPADQILSYHGQELTDPKKTLEQYGVIENDMLLLTKKPSQIIPRDGAPEIELMRQQILNEPQISGRLLQNQPELFNAAFNGPAQFAALFRQMDQRSRQQINIHNADPLNIEGQRRIEEEIRMQNVEKNWQTALERIPQFFARVVMLYIDIEVNGHPIKAFVDSGAQSTIMSPQCAEKCGLMRLIDQRYEGLAIGAGTAKIVGRVHYIEAEIHAGNLLLECSFLIMEGSEDVLFGLDMLMCHQACIDLKRKALIINDVAIPFLAEHELPERARMRVQDNNLQNANSNATSTNTQAESSATSSTTVIPPVSSNSSPPPASQSQYPEEHIMTLTSMGIPRDEAIRLLDATNGNVDAAASLFFSLST
ncbi:11143_t:CDS:10 [Scutellospora calospora]|uniref:11143_t:CDS:1 n=1 Tax=Scutellospora calospora TaxID=85575 RepID=A0ACA9MKB3_9GLOM|nr:11143_t:CDS:10 [Scutellospora calospora]